MVTQYRAPFTLSRYLEACRSDLQAYYTGVVDDEHRGITVTVDDGTGTALEPRELRLACETISSQARRTGHFSALVTFAAYLSWHTPDAMDRAAEFMAWAKQLSDESVRPKIALDIETVPGLEEATYYRMGWQIDHELLYGRRTLPETPEIRSVTILIHDQIEGELLDTVSWTAPPD